MEEKKVELLELFYDLIYVYAISQLTKLIENPTSFIDFIRYFVLFFVIIQAWLYLTNYINRYGHWKYYDYILITLNMMSTLYLSNTISIKWEVMILPFNISMFLMLLCIAVLYFIQVKKSEENKAAINSLRILLIVLSLYLLSFICRALNLNNIILYINVLAVLVGAFLPFFMQGHFDASIINFPHLVERFELLTIITFGESIVGLTPYFDITKLTLTPLILFLVIISLFGSYVLVIHQMVNHHRVERALRLMFSHYFIVMSINLLTVGFHLYHNNHLSHTLIVLLMMTSLLIFYISLFSNHYYFDNQYRFTKTFYLLVGISYIIALLITFIPNSISLIIGLLFMSVISFILLLTIFFKDSLLEYKR